MKLSLSIALRYLFGKKSTNAINIITGISIFGISVGTAALILILSVFNGFESLMKSYLDKYNPDLKLVAREGKFFKLDQIDTATLSSLRGIVGYSVVIEEVALLEYGNKQKVGIVKGVDKHYLQTTQIDETVTRGELKFGSSPYGAYAIAGSGVVNHLDISTDNRLTPLKIYVPNRRKRGVLDKDFTSRPLLITGVFTLHNERDNQYVITSYDLVSRLLDLPRAASAIEIRIDPSYDERRIVARIEELAGPEFVLLDRYEQEKSFLKIMNIEKWSSYVIFGFTLLLIVFNLIGSLWMIVLDKRKDISVLQSMGMTKKMIRRIFVMEGFLIGTIGFLLGLTFALIFYALQNSVGIISVPDNFSINAYPMEMELFDIAVIFVTVIGLGVLASLPAAWRAGRISAYVRME